MMKKHWGWKVNTDTISWWLAAYNRRHGTDFQFRNFRKTTNDMLVKHIGSKMVSGSTGELVAVEEISKHFLGQRTDLLVRLYRTTGKETYKRMNFYPTQHAAKIVKEFGKFSPDPSSLPKPLLKQLARLLISKLEIDLETLEFELEIALPSWALIDAEGIKSA